MNDSFNKGVIDVGVLSGVPVNSSFRDSCDETVAPLVSGRKKAFLMPLLIATVTITGTTTLIFVKWASMQSMPVCAAPDCPVKTFEAPMLQLVIQTTGETLCLGVHFVDKLLSRRIGREHGFLDFPCASDDIRQRTRWVNWIVPAVCDCSATLLLLYAIGSTAASTVQVLRNTQLLMCAFVSICWLRRDMRVHAWIGILILTAGLLVTTASQLRNGDDDDGSNGKNPATGVTLTLASTIMSAFCLVFVEHLYKRFRCSPFEAIGYMGLISLGIALAAMVVGHFIRVERIDEIWYQVLHDKPIATAMGLYLCSVALFNAAALSLIKIGSAMLTSVVFSSRQTLMWIADLSLRWKKFSWGDFCGMMLVLVGLLVYAGVLVSPCWPIMHKYQMKEVQIYCRCVDPDEDDDSESLDKSTYSDTGLSDSRASMLSTPTNQAGRRDNFPKIIMTGHENSFMDDGQELWIYVEKEVQYTQIDPVTLISHTPSARPYSPTTTLLTPNSARPNSPTLNTARTPRSPSPRP